LNRKVHYDYSYLDGDSTIHHSIAEPVVVPSLPVHPLPNMSAPNVLNAVSRWAVPIFIAVSFGQAAIYDVKGGTRAVIFDRLSGVQEKVVNEGTHFLVPWLQKAIVYDVRTKPRNISTTTGSKDLQMVSLTLRVLHRPEVQMLPKIYQVSSPSHASCLYCFVSNKTQNSPSAKTTTKESCHQLATKSSKPSWPNSMPPS
jgi:prohibitin 1